MRFRSGDSGRVYHQFTQRFSKNSLAFLDVCSGSLSCMNRCVDGKVELIIDRSATKFVYKSQHPFSPKICTP